MKSGIKLGIVCLIVLAMALVITRAIELPTADAAGPTIDGGGEITTRAAVPNLSSVVFLPLIARPCGGICGRVTYNGIGSSAAGIPLALRFYNGAIWSTLATTNTASDGSYSFNGVPSLGAGQRYYVLYLNNTNPAFLYYWQTALLTSFTASMGVTMGGFDIANIPLVSPFPGASVALPYTFQWTPRPATPSDSYEFNLYYQSGSPWWWTPKLGYVGSYILSSLPAGFYPGSNYGWYVAVYSPDGGYGESFYYRNVMFSNTGSSGADSSRESQPPKDFLENNQPRSLQR
jgi:hypothetical protein